MTLVVKIPLCPEMIRFLSQTLRSKILYLVHPHPNFIFFCLCLHRWERYVESANKGMNVFDMGQFDFSWIRIRISFKQFLDFALFSKSWVQFKALNVLCWMVSEKPRVRFPPALWKVCIQPLSTSSFASLSVTFLAYFKIVMKISKGFRKWTCFRKIGLNTSLIVSIVTTETSVTKVMSHKYKFHVLKWKMLISLSHQTFFLDRSNAKSHSFFSLTVMFNLTSFWVRDNSISLSQHRNLVNITITNYSLSCLQFKQLYDGRFLLPGTALVPFAHNNTS